MTWHGSVWSKFENIGASNVKIVRSNETVQQVLDSITDASETNKYLVFVPPGHENEFFFWKPNVDVEFLDNLEERWQLDELEGWDDLSNWDVGSGFDAEIVEEEDSKKIKLSAIAEGTHSLSFASPLDLRKYQGLVFDFEFSIPEGVDSSSLIRMNITFADNVYKQTKNWVYPGTGDYCLRYFLSFGDDYLGLSHIEPDLIDWSSVRITFFSDSDISFEGSVLKLSNFRLVRTFPYPVIHISIFSSVVGLIPEFIGELQKRGIRPSLRYVASRIRGLTTTNSNYFSVDLLNKLKADVINGLLYHEKVNSYDSKKTNFVFDASKVIFKRAGLSLAAKWIDLPYKSFNSTLVSRLRGHSVLFPLIFGLPIAYGCSLDDLLTQLPVLKVGGVYHVSLDSNDLDSEDKVEGVLSKIDTLREMCRFISLREIEDCYFLSNGNVFEFTYPAFYYTASADENLDISFYHRYVFIDPNGFTVNLNLSYVGLRSGDKVHVFNTGSAGKVVFDPIGVNKEILPGENWEFLYY